MRRRLAGLAWRTRVQLGHWAPFALGSTLAVVALLDLPGDNRSVAYVNENLEPQGGAIARRETIRVDVSLLRPPPGSTSCRRLTVFASSGFERIDIGQPIEPGALARAVYWLRVVDPPEQEVDLTECP